METTTKPNHIGRKFARIRELRGTKQESLAEELGVSQQSVSHMEQSEHIEEDLLQRVSKALGVSPEGIKRFSEEVVINFFNNFRDISAGIFNNHFTFNPLDKLMEAYEENKKLYERLLEEERNRKN